MSESAPRARDRPRPAAEAERGPMSQRPARRFAPFGLGLVALAPSLTLIGWAFVERPPAASLAEPPLLVAGASGLLAALGLGLLRRRRARPRPPAVPAVATASPAPDARCARCETLTAMLRAANEAIILCATNGRIEIFNPAAEMLFGCLAEEVVGQHFDSLVDHSPDDSTPLALALLAAEVDGHAVHEAQARRHGDRPFPARLRLHRLDAGRHRRVLIFAEDLAMHEQQEGQAAYLRRHDLLTGLLNRREFERRVEAALRDPAGRRQPRALCHLDVDQFKIINSTCGHAAGDRLLQQLALLIQNRLGEKTSLARIGGDEFAAFFSGRDGDEVLAICEELQQTVRNFLFTWCDQSFDVAVSIGLIAFTADEETASSALSKADIACHTAKHNGRDRLHVYSDGDAELIRHHGDMHMVSAITRALSDGRFRLVAQPIVALQGETPEPPHYEILVRMLDETGQVVIPGRFIPAAERYILMPAVDRWVIHRILSTQADNLRAWHARYPDRFLFAINLSGTSLGDEGFLSYLKRQFADWAVPFASICFEITETAAVRSLERARALMEELAGLGVRFALDDFGTGLSSYGYLRDLPVSLLKIDGAFVRGLSDDPVNRAMVESINQIGHVLGLQTIAEWAEDGAAIEALRALGVDYAQGYGVGAALPVDGFQIRFPTTASDVQSASSR
ncbi:diguanylate cyclase [Thiococcus pfennigii]|nr:diguanylate cyclase [Thiococcus pfennigii]